MPVHTIRFRSGRSGPVHVAKRAAVALLALAALFTVAAAALIAIGGNWLREPAQRMALEKTGRELRIDGDIRLHLGWPLLRVEADHVAFANADWMKNPPDMLSADAVAFGLRLPSLLTGRIVLDEVRLRNADVALAKDEQGRKNWELPGGPSQTVVHRLALENSRVDYSEPARKTALHADVSADAGGIAFSAAGQLAGLALQARGRGGPLLALSDETGPYPFQVEATAGPTRATAQGSVTGLSNLAALDVQADVRGSSLERLFPLLGVALPETPAYRVAGRIVHEGRSWRFEKLKAHVGDSDVAGDLVVDLSGPRPALSGELVFGPLDVADLGVTIGAGRTETPGRVLPDAAFNAERWNTLDADLKLSAQKIARPHGLPLERFATHLRLRDAVLTLDPLEFGIAGGRLSGTIALDGREQPIGAKARLRVDKIALDRLVPGFNTAQVDPGRIDGSVDLAGKGDSVGEMLGSAGGNVDVLVNGGHVSRLVMEMVGLHVPQIVALKVGGDELVPIRCAAADLKVEDGIAQARTLVFDTAVTTVEGAGSVDLDEEKLDLTLTPRTKETSLFSLHGPIRVRGSFAKPDVQVDKGRIAAKSLGAAALAIANPLLALAPLIETGPGTDSDCGRLLNAPRK